MSIDPKVKKEMKQRYYLLRREEILAKHKVYRSIHHKEILSKKRINYELNKEKINNLRRINYKKNSTKYARQNKKYSQKYPERVLHKKLQHLYGITLEQYNLMSESQGGVCAGCRRPETTVRNGNIQRLSVDHDHNTKRVRGLLCTKCNRTLGLVGECPSTLRLLAEYIEKDYKE